MGVGRKIRVISRSAKELNMHSSFLATKLQNVITPAFNEHSVGRATINIDNMHIMIKGKRDMQNTVIIHTTKNTSTPPQLSKTMSGHDLLRVPYLTP